MDKKSLACEPGSMVVFQKSEKTEAERSPANIGWLVDDRLAYWDGQLFNCGNAIS